MLKLKNIKSLLALSLLVSSLEATPTHCLQSEDIIFSCQIGQKTVSLCSKDWKIGYRYGKIGNTELQFSNRSTTGGVVAYAGGGGTYLRVYNGPLYSYLLYTASGKGWEKAGLNVEKNGRTIREFTCKDRSKVLSQIGPNLFEQYNIPQDGGFDAD